MSPQNSLSIKLRARYLTLVFGFAFGLLTVLGNAHWFMQVDRFSFFWFLHLLIMLFGAAVFFGALAALNDTRHEQRLLITVTHDAIRTQRIVGSTVKAERCISTAGIQRAWLYTLLRDRDRSCSAVLCTREGEQNIEVLVPILSDGDPIPSVESEERIAHFILDALGETVEGSPPSPETGIPESTLRWMWSAPS